jgi:alkanesulfonate monooxygenase SsuD/methylene tetrahydromethanopterin reductase-like flavin-dependent oxidoreductase (luciferase family)
LLAASPRLCHFDLMRFAIDVPNFGAYADPRTLAALAREAEDAGWDGFFIWDHIQVGWPDPVADPWVALAAIAAATSRVRLGPLVTPVFRRNPWKLAREAVSLDYLSNGRLVLGVGLGDDIFTEITTFNGSLDNRVRAAMLDEGLAVLTGLWSGAPFSFAGSHYVVRETTFLPTPIQQPRIPIWVAGMWPNKPPFRRAARYDGVVPISTNIEHSLPPDEVRALIIYIRKHRSSAAPFDVVCSGETNAGSIRAREIVAPYAEAGATWWLESVLPWKTSFADFRARVVAGPPRLE